MVEVADRSGRWLEVAQWLVRRPLRAPIAMHSLEHVRHLSGGLLLLRVTLRPVPRLRALSKGEGVG